MKRIHRAGAILPGVLLAVAAGCLLSAPVLAESDPAAAATTEDDAKKPGVFRRFLHNRYLGAALRLSSMPYAGDERDIAPFPVISRLTDYHFTEQRFFSREGVAGIRFVRSNPWEFGTVISIESLGYEAEDSIELTGMQEREGSLDGGVFAAYRTPRWYIEFVGVTDLLDRHEGDQVTVTFAVPWRSDDETTVIVPHLDLVYRDADRVDYYFGVRPEEALPGRPRFTGEDAASPRLAVRGWHRFRDSRWAIKGALHIESLSDEITASPIVDDDYILGFNIGLAYRFGADAGKPASN